ncbi:MAG: guided entry of tail-anchored proteins factor 1 [Clostridia bacterium]|nr:guided entry of tail-anchored proteins factor 1 [Clostridia bacterium]
MADALSADNHSRQLTKLRKEIATIENKRSKLVDMRLEETIAKDEYEAKYTELGEKLEQLIEELAQLQESAEHEKTIKKRLTAFKQAMEKHQVLPGFDREVFEAIVEKVIIGKREDDGTINPYRIIFVYKAGFSNDVDGGRFKPRRKNARADAKLCSHADNGVFPVGWECFRNCVNGII